MTLKPNRIVVYVLLARLILIFLCVGLVYLVLKYTEGFNVVTKSMEPTILYGDTVLSKKINAIKPGLKRGELIVFMIDEIIDKTGQTETNIYVRRIVGLPGEKIEVKHQKGIFVNNKELNETYIQDAMSNLCDETYDYCGPLEVPENHYYVLGDNREMATDSRKIGPVGVELIRSKLVSVSWPASRSRVFQIPDYSSRIENKNDQN